ncbi:MAG: hypothetical protein H0X64_03240 [Gemmatimonadaceae bacterium]|nr:hypothetical protein [Gemmatimonadaceae bacterium]
MQVRVVQGQPARVQRDGPSLSQQAAEARVQELQVEMSAAMARVQELMQSGAPGSASGREALTNERASIQHIAAQMRQQEAILRSGQIEEATAAAIAGAFGARQAPRASTGVSPREQGIPDVPPHAKEVAMLFIVCLAAAIILTPLMRALGRIIERRSTPPARLAPEIQSQLTRMEQAIDAVALEVERVSEGQRFATRLLSEREKVGELRS